MSKTVRKFVQSVREDNRLNMKKYLREILKEKIQKRLDEIIEGQ